MDVQSSENIADPSSAEVLSPFELIRPLVVSSLDVRETISSALFHALGTKKTRWGTELTGTKQLIERVGYSISIVFIEPDYFGWQYSAQWIFYLRENYPWLTFVLLVDEQQFEANISQFKELQRLEHYFRLPLVDSEKEFQQLISEQYQYWLDVKDNSQKPPLPPEHTQYLTSFAGVLFSVCHTEAPWQLDADAIVVPMGRQLNEMTILARDTLDALGIEDIKPETVDGQMVKALGSGKVYELVLSNAPARPYLLFAGAPDSRDFDQTRLAIEAARAAIEWAQGKEDCQTLALPMLVRGIGEVDAGKFISGLISSLANDFERGGLRHVVITDVSDFNVEQMMAQAEFIGESEVSRADSMHNDEPSGDDQLGVKGQLEALADAIALREMSPPLVVGILGGWGSGKSFAMHIIEQRLKWIRGLTVPDKEEQPQAFEDFPYIGHPYIVRFDSWTYAKSELWASLMQKILQDLDEQLSLEHMLHQAGADARDGVDLWQLMSRLNKKERSAFDTLLDEKHLDKFMDLKDEGGTQALWDVLKQARCEEETTLDKAEKALTEKRDELDTKLAKTKLDLDEHRFEIEVYRQRAIAEETARAEIEAKVIEGRKNHKLQVLNSDWETERNRARQALKDELKQVNLAQGKVDEMAAQLKQQTIEKREVHRKQIELEQSRASWGPVKELAVKLLGDSIDSVFTQVAKQSGDAPLSIEKVRKEVGMFKPVIQGWNGYSSAFVAFVIVILASPWLLQKIDVAVESLIPNLTALGASLVAIYNRIAKFRGDFLKLEKTYQAELSKAKEDSGDTLEQRVNQDMQDAREALAKKLLEIDELRNRAQAKAEGSIDNAQVLLAQNITETLDNAATEIQALRKQALANANSDSEAFERAAIKKLQICEQALLDAKTERDKVIIELENQVSYHRQRAGITVRSKSLLEFVSQRNSDGYYDKQLGVIHQVQKDLEEITDALLPLSLEEKQGEAAPDGRFVRGEPRIILLVDDLDRCPPETVVKMLEAAQLLVKTRLFVVVLAMDVRYVTRALEHEYKGILVRDGDPSGLDYIEKIVQVPYRVPSINPEFMKSFLSKQMTMVESEGGQTPEQSAQQSESVTPPVNDSDYQRIGSDDGLGGKKVFFKVPDTNPGEVVPAATLAIEGSELELLSEACNAVRITPRAATRLTNVYKLLKIIWHKASIKTPPETQKMVVLLLALSSRFPEIMRKLLQDLDNAFHEANDISMQTTIQSFMLNKLECDTLTQSYRQELAECRSILENKNHIASDFELIELGHDNLRLVLSFCFTGEVSNNPSTDNRTEGDD